MRFVSLLNRKGAKDPSTICLTYRAGAKRDSAIGDVVWYFVYEAYISAHHYCQSVMRDVGNKGNLLVSFGTPVKCVSL